MWKIPLSGLLCVLLPLAAAAEVVCALGSGASAYNPSSDQRPTSDAMEVARRMNAALSPICSPKCPQIAIFRNALPVAEILEEKAGVVGRARDPRTGARCAEVALDPSRSACKLACREQTSNTNGAIPQKGSLFIPAHHKLRLRHDRVRSRWNATLAL